MRNSNYISACKYLERYHSSLFQEILPKIEKPIPHFRHTILFPQILNRFCELKKVDQSLLVGVGKGREGTRLKTVFIGVVVKLYNPELLTGIHSEKMRSNLRDELAALLNCAPPWISHAVNDIITYLNEAKAYRAYEEFRNEVNELCENIKENVKENERFEIKHTPMFPAAVL